MNYQSHDHIGRICIYNAQNIVELLFLIGRMKLYQKFPLAKMQNCSFHATISILILSVKTMHTDSPLLPPLPLCKTTPWQKYPPCPLNQ